MKEKGHINSVITNSKEKREDSEGERRPRPNAEPHGSDREVSGRVRRKEGGHVMEG